MPEKGDSFYQDYNQSQQHIKPTPNTCAPEVTREWPAEKIPWYIQYVFDWILFMIVLLFIVARAVVSNEGWTTFLLVYILIGLFFMWLVTISPEEHER